MSDPWWLRVARSAAATAILSIALFVAAIVYTSTGGSARELLVKELLVNLMLVLGLQVFMGNTGILSFGHLAFAQIAAYAVAICTIPVAAKTQALPDLPFGLGDVHLGAPAATLVGVLVALALGALVGIAVARTGGLAAAMITLAVLFVIDQVVKNWQELTKGAGGLSGVPTLEGTVWLWLAAGLAMFVAHWFGETRAGRFAVATREDEIAAPSLGIGMFGARLTAWTVSIAVDRPRRAHSACQTIGSTNPRQYTLDAAVLVLAMLVVGGMRTVTGAVVGTVIITVGNETFRQLGDPQRLDIERFPDLFLGVALLLVMLLRPGGLLGDIDLAGWLRRITHRSPDVRQSRRARTLSRSRRRGHRGPLRWLHGARRSRAPRAAGRGDRPDRAERCGQDDAVQRRHGPRANPSRVWCVSATAICRGAVHTTSPGPAWRGRSRTCACSATCPCGRT